MRALMIGRFQPFHLGHLHLARGLLKEYDEVIVALTSAQFNYIERDPFTAGERLEMIRQSLKDDKADLSRCMVVPIENQPNNSAWASYLRSALPNFDVIVSGNQYVKMLLADSGVEVIEPKFLERDKYNASKIRQMIIQDNSWEDYVPGAVARIIGKIGGAQRLRVISGSDTRPAEH